MSNLKQSLTRKLGPLPVWVWTIGAGILLYIARSRGLFGGSKSAVPTSATSPGTGAEPPPQDIVPLQPGESAYDPNSGQLLTAPGSSGGGNGGGAGIPGEPGAPGEAGAPGTPADPATPPTVSGNGNGLAKPTTHIRPGEGKHPHHKRKPKPGKKHKKPTSKGRGRGVKTSLAALRSKNGGRHTGQQKKTGNKGRGRGVQSSAGSGQRAHGRTRATGTRTVKNQHPQTGRRTGGAAAPQRLAPKRNTARAATPKKPATSNRKRRK